MTTPLKLPAASNPVPDLLVVVVNFRTPDLTIQCLKSLETERTTLPSLRVVVVDNASGDDSAVRLARALDEYAWRGWCSLVESPRNGGFAYGNNRGIEAGPRARYTLLLNSDTIVHAGCLRSCLDLMDADARLGALSCKLLNADGTIQNVARKFPTPAKLMLRNLGLPWKFPRLFAWADTDDEGWDRASTARDVEWIGGAFVFIRDSVLERVGGLDEEFFFYGEDIEFSHAVWKHGWRVRYDPSSSTTHLGGSSSDPSRMNALARSQHFWRGRYLVQRKCHGRLAAWSVWAADMATHAMRTLWYRVCGRTGSHEYQFNKLALETLLRERVLV